MWPLRLCIKERPQHPYPVPRNTTPAQKHHLRQSPFSYGITRPRIHSLTDKRRPNHAVACSPLPFRPYHPGLGHGPFPWGDDEAGGRARAAVPQSNLQYRKAVRQQYNVCTIICCPMTGSRNRQPFARDARVEKPLAVRIMDVQVPRNRPLHLARWPLALHPFAGTTSSPQRLRPMLTPMLVDCFCLQLLCSAVTPHPA